MIHSLLLTNVDSFRIVEEILKELDLDVFQQVSETNAGISFEKLMNYLLQGNMDGIGNYLLEQLEHLFMNAFGAVAISGTELFLYVLLSSVFGIFASSVVNNGVNETIHLVIYLLYFSASCLLVKEYLMLAMGYLQNMLDIFQLLFPAWMITVTALAGPLTIQSSYAIGYFCILMLERGITKVFPFIIYGYAIVRFTGNTQKQDVLSSFGDLIKKGYEGVLKGVLICVTGVQFFQNLFLPFLDGITKHAAGKILSGIPGIGQGVEATLQMTISAVVLIKNSLGAVFILLIVIATLEPVVRFLVFFLLYRLGVAVFQPVANAQMLKGLQTMSDCCLLILKTVGMTSFLFLLMISLICSATNIASYVS